MEDCLLQDHSVEDCLLKGIGGLLAPRPAFRLWEDDESFDVKDDDNFDRALKLNVLRVRLRLKALKVDGGDNDPEEEELDGGPLRPIMRPVSDFPCIGWPRT